MIETAEAEDGCSECRSSDGLARASTWQPGPAPSSEEFHRVELEWLKQG